MGRTGIGIVCMCLWTVGVVVCGTTSDYDNVATNKTYQQSSKYHSKKEPNMAANGDTTGNYPLNGIHTKNKGDLQPWWEVDLGRTYPVKQIVIWARPNFERRLYPFNITVDGEMCASASTGDKSINRSCPDVMYGQKVRITRYPNDCKGDNSTLNLSELQILVPREVSQCPAGKRGNACEEDCSIHCGKGPGRNFCYKGSGKCYDGCVAGRYGDQCSTACSPGCANITCERKTGQCGPCTSPYTGDKCSDCVAGWYGDQCSTACSPGCANITCERKTGQCGPCTSPYTGDKCAELAEKDNIGGAVGGVVAVIVVIALVTGVIAVVRRRRRAATSGAQDSEMANAAQTQSGQRQEGSQFSLQSLAPVIVSGEHGPITEPVTSDGDLVFLRGGEEPGCSSDPAYTSVIRLDQLKKVVVDTLHSGQIAEQFQLIVGVKDYPCTNGKREENWNKNRFNSILPYDKNCVVLDPVDGDAASDYINASFIKGYKINKAYIAAQGPRSITQDDFWRMVWQEGVTDIVMLTNVKEGNKGKCHKYWPSKGRSLLPGHMEVTGLEEEERANFTIRTFSVRQLQIYASLVCEKRKQCSDMSNDKRQVRQYHYLNWMDHEVPATTSLVDFWRYVRARAPRTATAPPLVVHCSAGVGRTGTYIALDILMDQTQEEEEISLFRTVDSLREDRCHMVQNKGQYEFLHEAVVEAYLSGDCRQDTSSFDRLFPHTVHHHLPHQRLDAEFGRLCQMRTCFTTPSHTVASLEENRQKNRHPDALPGDKHLVYITEHAKGRNQYINAVYMPTFLSSQGSIVTQLPLADTVIDLWRLVDSWDVTTIVSIGQGDGGRGMVQFWPQTKDQPVTSGAYTISLQGMTSRGECLNSYTLDVRKKDARREVRVLHYEAWTGEVADNVSDLIHLLDILHTSHKQSTKEPIIVQCIDGVAQSGVVCALWEIISRMTYDDEVDVYQAVRHVHTVRPEAISSVVQYKFLYEVVRTYIASHSIYVNT